MSNDHVIASAGCEKEGKRERKEALDQGRAREVFLCVSWSEYVRMHAEAFKLKIYANANNACTCVLNDRHMYVCARMLCMCSLLDWCSGLHNV